MSYRSFAAQYIAAGQQTKRFDVVLENGKTGVIAARDERDAAVEATRWAKFSKSAVKTIVPQESSRC